MFHDDFLNIKNNQKLMQLSQTQLANIMSLAGLLVIIANQFNFVIDQNQIAFGISAIWTLGWTAYNYWQRFKKGDLTLSGVRK